MIGQWQAGDSNHFGRLMSFSRRRVVYAKTDREWWIIALPGHSTIIYFRWTTRRKSWVLWMVGQTARSVIFTWKACERISQMPTMTRIPCLPLAAENVSLSRAILHNSWIFRCTLCTRGIWIIRIPPVDHHPMKDARRSTLLFQSRRGQSVWLARDHQASYWNRSLHCMWIDE